MTNFIEALLQISLSTAAVIGVMLLLVPLWQKRYSARWRKGIWLLIALRLLVPISLELPQTAVQLEMDLQAAPAWQGKQMPEDNNAAAPASTPTAEAEALQAIDDGAREPQAAASPSATVLPMQQPISRGMLLFAVWLAGAAAFLLWHGVHYAFFRHKALAVAQPLEDREELLQQAADALPLKAVPRVVVSAAVQGPMLLGFVRPVVLLPQRFYGHQELMLILRHELTHYKLHDLWYKLILLVANAAHWFNPLVWLLVRQANRDVEQVCDEQVVRNQDMAYRKAYSMTILNTMANQKGVALSTYLSKQAQNSKKRFAAILYPQKYAKGLFALAAVVLLAVVASGCLQVGKISDGVEAYEQIAAYLPAGLNLQEADCVQETLEMGYQRSLWRQYSAPDTAPDYWVSLYCNAEGQVVEMENSISQQQLQHNAEQNLTERQAQQLANACLTDWSGEARELLPWGSNEAAFYTPELAEQEYGWTAASEEADYYYDIIINSQYGYVKHFKKYYANLQLRQQALDWLATEETRLYNNYYHILYFTADAVQEYYQDDSYTITLLYTMYHQNDGNPDDAGYIQWAKENEPEEYQGLYEAYNKVQSGTMALKLEAALRADGTLDMEHCTMYQAMDDAGGTTEWQQIPGLYVYLQDGRAEVAGWSSNKTQALWTADCYLQAYQKGDTEMMRRFSTMEPLSAPEEPILQGQDAAASAQTLRNQLVRNFKAQYGGQTSVEDSTTVQLWVSKDILSQAHDGDLLYMTLQKVDGQWKVTAVSVETVR